jgi:hypothetical protein
MFTEEQQQSMQSAFSQALHGWEAGPFKNSRHQLDIRPLQVEDRTQLYLVGTGEGQPVVAKRHSDWMTYFRELRGFELLGSQAPIPRLIAASDSNQFIVMEYLPDSWKTETTPHLCEVAKALGRLHACGSRNSRFLKSFSQEATLGFLIRNTDSYAWVEDVEALREALSLSLKLGESYVPIQLGDLKDGHLRAREGECALIDLETLTVGGIEWFDILSLLNITPNKKLDASDWVALVQAYIAGCDSVGELALSISDTLTTLHLTAVALGLPASVSESIPLTC